MKRILLASLLDLANATSQNLAFAHRDDVNISFGEETITETNLLELRRRHPAAVRLHTFGKRSEALNGADWEWHIIGTTRTLRMRVQAKRLQKDDRLKIAHKVASSGSQQIDLLIADAKKFGLKPVYCFYSSEAQRTVWKKLPAVGILQEFEYGCLLASAYRVKARWPAALGEIETDCIPWHYLVERNRYTERKFSASSDGGPAITFVTATQMSDILSSGEKDTTGLEEFPTVDELNAPKKADTDFEGVVDTRLLSSFQPISAGAYLERGITKLVEIDVRSGMLSD